MKVLVCSPVWRAFEAAHVLALFNQFTRPEFEWYPLVNDAAIDRARSRGATYFLEKTDADVCLWIDSDLDWNDDDAVTICRQAMEYGIVCGIYPTRSGSQAIPASRLLMDRAYTFGTDPTPQPILWAAGGFVAVHRRVYERLAKEPEMALLHEGDETLRMRPFYWQLPLKNDDGSPVWGAEDWSFSERARLAGYPSYANCAVELAHIGVYRYGLHNLFTQPQIRRPIRFTRTREGNLVEHPGGQ